MSYVSLDRYKRTVVALCDLLKQHPDGLIVQDMVRLLHSQKSVLCPVLEDNPLFYVDRWATTKTRYTTSICRVWMVVDFDNPGNCPPPDIMSKT